MLNNITAIVLYMAVTIDYNSYYWDTYAILVTEAQDKVCCALGTGKY